MDPIDMNISSLVQEMSPQQSNFCSPASALTIRVVTLFFLLSSVMATAKSNPPQEFYASTFLYLMAIGVVGSVYTALQIAFGIYFVRTGTRLGGRALRLFDFFADKALTYFMTTGPPTAFAVINFNPNSMSSNIDFEDKIFTAAGLLFLGSVSSLVSSVFSAFALPKKA